LLIIKNEDVAGTFREVHCSRGGFVSYRYILKRENMGFGLHRTEIPKGDWQHWHYKHHKEACYCVSGDGLLKSATTGEIFKISPGVCYVLDKHDDHFFKALTDVVLISVFNPPVVGTEVHNEDGSYSKGDQE
jgi:L-ectoine synthase